MPSSKRVDQWGVKMPDGSIEGPANPAECNEGYMTCEEYVKIRARVTGGVVVCRTVVTSTSEWEEQQ